MLSDEFRYKILKRLEADPDVSQRALASDLGISLGRANYCLRALVDKGLVKANNFRTSRNKAGYVYLLTPKGIEEKAKLTIEFLKIKLVEHEELKREIASLQQEARQIVESQNAVRIPGKDRG